MEPRLKQHAGRGARPQARPIAHLERALKFHIVAALTNVLGAELREFLGQHRGGTHRRGCDPIADIVVHAQCTSAVLQARKSCQSRLG